MSDTKIDKARASAWEAARNLAGGDNHVAKAVVHAAEMAALRKIAADYLDDGEEGYWRMVERDIKPK